MDDSYDVTLKTLCNFEHKVYGSSQFLQILNYVNWCQANVYYYKFVMIDGKLTYKLLEFEDHGGTDNVIVIININYNGPKYSDPDYIETDNNEEYINEELFSLKKDFIEFPINNNTIRIFNYNDNSVYDYRQMVKPAQRLD